MLVPLLNEPGSAGNDMMIVRARICFSYDSSAVEARPDRTCLLPEIRSPQFGPRPIRVTKGSNLTQTIGVTNKANKDVATLPKGLPMWHERPTSAGLIITVCASSFIALSQLSAIDRRSR